MKGSTIIRLTLLTVAVTHHSHADYAKKIYTLTCVIE